MRHSRHTFFSRARLLGAVSLAGLLMLPSGARAQEAADVQRAVANVLEAPLQADLLPGLDIKYVRAAIVLLPAQRALRGSVTYTVSKRAGAASGSSADSLVLRAGAVHVASVAVRMMSRDGAARESAAPVGWTHRSDTLRIALPANEGGTFFVQVDYETSRVGYDLRDRGGWKAVWTPSRPDAAHWIPHPLAWSDPFAADLRIKTPPGWQVAFPRGRVTRLPGPDHSVHVWQPPGEYLAHGLGFLAMDVDGVLKEVDAASEAGAASDADSLAEEMRMFLLPEGHPSHFWPGLVLRSDDMPLETEPLMGRFQHLTERERLWAAPLATATYWTDSWLHEAAVSWRALEALGEEEGAAAVQRVLEVARLRYLAEPYRRPLVWDRWQHPFDLEDAHARWKGLWVLHMLSAHTSAHAVGTALDALREAALTAPVDTEDFRLALEAAWPDGDISDFFDTWIYSAGHPQLSVIHSHVAASEKLTVIVEQQQDGGFVPPSFSLEGQLVVSSIAGAEVRPFQSGQRTTRLEIDMPLRPRYVHFRSRRPLLMEYVPPPDEVDVTAWIRDAESGAERVSLLTTIASGSPDASLLIGLRPVLEAASMHVRVAAMPVLAAMAPSASALRLLDTVSRPDGQSPTPGADTDLLFARMGAVEAFSADDAAALALETANTSQDGFLLERAVRLLVAHRPAMAWQVLESALVTDSGQDRIRRLAIRLVETSDRGARERLAALLPLTVNPHHPTTRGEALLAAARVDPTNSTVRRRTAAWLPDERPALRAAAIEALELLPEDAVPSAAISDALERETRPALRRALQHILSNRDA